MRRAQENALKQKNKEKKTKMREKNERIEELERLNKERENALLKKIMKREVIKEKYDKQKKEKFLMEHFLFLNNAYFFNLFSPRHFRHIGHHDEVLHIRPSSNQVINGRIKLFIKGLNIIHISHTIFLNNFLQFSHIHFIRIT